MWTDQTQPPQWELGSLSLAFPSDPQARHSPATWATSVSLPCVMFPVLSSHHAALSAYSFLTEPREPLRTIPGHQHKLERSGTGRGGRLGETGIPSLPNYISTWLFPNAHPLTSSTIANPSHRQENKLREVM